jgi:methylthioribose-1-phosphate isomerase
MTQSPPTSHATLWFDHVADAVKVIDQTRLPFETTVLTLESLEQVEDAIITMKVRGAPLIGITAAFGVYLSLKVDPHDLQSACACLLQTRPTAVNLRWALDRMLAELQGLPAAQRASQALTLAQRILDEDVAACSAIGDYGLKILQELYQLKRARHGDQAVLNILTHCNAGWLATGAWGTALAPIYKARLAGIPVHVWVDETRPRSQGASLTAWELAQSKVPHTLIVDNAGGHLMQSGMVDVCLVGSDRTTASGDVCNKIGTYLKALAAHDNGVPFYAALPVSTVDFEMMDGVREIPIEERSAEEVTHVQGLDDSGKLSRVRVAAPQTGVSNFGFDVTPARLVSGLITEFGVYPATEEGLASLKTAAAVDFD